MNEKPKYGSPEYLIEEAQEKLNKALLEVSKIRKEVGTIKNVEVLSIPTFYGLSHYYSQSSYYHTRNFDPENRAHVDNAYQNAIKKINELIAHANAVHEANKEALENNVKTKQSIIDFMSAIGIASSYSVYELPSSRHKNKVKINKSAGYMNDIDRCIKTNDFAELVIKKCQEQRKNFDRGYSEMLIKVNKKEQEEKKKVEEAESIMELARFQVKYETTGGWDSVLDKILEKDKYLHLAHYLLKNREDWNDGCSSAEYGLSQFSVETDVDKEIEKEILSMIGENWDGDGRCFRDADVASYGNLFSMVKDNSLHQDYEKVKEKINY